MKELNVVLDANAEALKDLHDERRKKAKV